MIKREIPKLKNCATIKISITRDGINSPFTFSLELIYEGDIKSKNMTGKNYLELEWARNNFPKENTPSPLPFKIDPLFGKNINIFLIRHGEGDHNLVKGFKKFQDKGKNVTDAMLTSYGIQQAKDCAKELIHKNLTFYKIYASRLRRAFNTASVIMDELNVKQDVKQNEITILPCSHELTVSSKLNILNTAENSSLCTTKSTRDTAECKTASNNPTYYKINWSLFDLTFSKWHQSEYLTCSLNNNMIQFIIRDIIKNK
jgi:phosphohistidine phosphatase SixA